MKADGSDLRARLPRLPAGPPQRPSRVSVGVALVDLTAAVTEPPMESLTALEIAEFKAEHRKEVSAALLMTGFGGSCTFPELSASCDPAHEVLNEPADFWAKARH